MTSILVFFHVESLYNSIWVYAQRLLFRTDFFRKHLRRLDISIVGEELENLQKLDGVDPRAIKDIPMTVLSWSHSKEVQVS